MHEEAVSSHHLRAGDTLRQLLLLMAKG